MKAELNENGKLTITAETGLESFALRHWSDDFMGQIEFTRTGKCALAVTTKLGKEVDE